MKNWPIRLFAVAAIVLVLWLYVREFRVFDNTIGIKNLALSSIGLAIAAAVLGLVSQRKRLVLLEDKLPIILSLLIFPALFAPLVGSLINRLGASDPGERSFVFQKETPFRMSRFGFLAMLQKEAPTGYHLFVADGGKNYRFTYQKQAYFPLTKPGEVVLLPVKTGLLGFCSLAVKHQFLL